MSFHNGAENGQPAVQDAISSAIAFLPRLAAAILILIVGWIIGRIIGRFVRALVRRTPIDDMTLDTPIGAMMGGTQESVSRGFGTIAAWFVYALAFLAAADVLAIQMLSEWIAQAVAYLPSFFGGLAFVLLGFIVADFVGDMIERTRAATDTRYTTWFADGVRMFLYFIVLVIGLDTMGISVEFLYIIAGAFASGLALAVAIGAGIAFGLGAQDYIRENIDDWVRRGKEEAASSGDGGRGGGRGGDDRGTAGDEM